MTRLVPSSRPRRRARLKALGALMSTAAVTLGLLVLPTAAATATDEGTLRVSVTDASTRSAVRGAEVRITSRTTWEQVATRSSDSAGRVSVVLPADDYLVAVSHADFASLYYPATFDQSAADTVAVAAGKTSDIGMALSRGGSAEIAVTYGNGLPAEDASVHLLRLGEYYNAEEGQCETASNGRCSVANLGPGQYIAVGEVARGDERYPDLVGGAWPSRTQSVTIGSGQHVQGTITLPAAVRATGVIRLPFQHPASLIEADVTAVYEDTLDGEYVTGDYARIAPGGSAPFELWLEPGRPFRLELRGWDTETGMEVIVTEQWTPTGMEKVGSVITVRAGERPHFEVEGRLGATIGGTVTIDAHQGESGTRTVEVGLLEKFGAGSDLAFIDTVVVDVPVGGSRPFQFTGLPTGQYTLALGGDGVCHEFWQDKEFYEDVDLFEVTKTGTATALDARLQLWSTGCEFGPEPDELPEPDRLAGGDRFATSVAISQRSFPGTASVVYLASGMNYPDGLAAGPAAAHQGGPVLLTPPGAVPQSVLDEIERLKPAEIVIVGGTPSVSANAEQQVRALDPKRDVVRLGGADRFETSRMIADYAFDSADAAFLATGLKFPDALTAGPAAALLGGPVLLVHGTVASPDAATLATLDELGVSWVGIAGDDLSVSAGFERGLRSAARDVERFSGEDRFATAAQIGALFDAPSTVVVASGLGFADALPGAAAAGTIGAPMLLSRSVCVPAPSLGALGGWMPRDVWLLGGQPTLGPAVADYIACD